MCKRSNLGFSPEDESYARIPQDNGDEGVEMLGINVIFIYLFYIYCLISF
jgi:hypothetical protein